MSPDGKPAAYSVDNVHNFVHNLFFSLFLSLRLWITLSTTFVFSSFFSLLIRRFVHPAQKRRRIFPYLPVPPSVNPPVSAKKNPVRQKKKLPHPENTVSDQNGYSWMRQPLRYAVRIKSFISRQKSTFSAVF